MKHIPLGKIQSDAVVAIYDTHAKAEAAIRKLQKSGFNMKKLSIIGRVYHTDEHVLGYYNTGDRVRYWSKVGASWGTIWGILIGSAFLIVPGLGPIAAAGPVVTLLAGALEGLTIGGGVSALAAWLYSFGFGEDSVLRYEEAIQKGRFLVVAHGKPEELEHARNILSKITVEVFGHCQMIET